MTYADSRDDFDASGLRIAGSWQQGCRASPPEFVAVALARLRAAENGVEALAQANRWSDVWSDHCGTRVVKVQRISRCRPVPGLIERRPVIQAVTIRPRPALRALAAVVETTARRLSVQSASGQR